VRLDDTDKAIIQHLQADGRMPYTRLGPLVGLSAPATRQRVLHLIDSGVMEVVAVTDPRTLGFEIQALIGIHTSGGPRAAADFMAGLEEVDYLAITTGRFDIICEVVCENNDHLLELMERLGAHASITSIEVFSFVSLVKQTYDWGTR
jgi:Lrp/AsnC family transcriptional regulator for asnA, asnC and gidA